MKKAIKILSLPIILVLLSLCLISTTNIHKGKTDLGFSWELNVKTQTLTIDEYEDVSYTFEEYDESNKNPPWKKYSKDIKHIVYGENASPYLWQPFLKTIATQIETITILGEVEGTSLYMDIPSNTSVLKGKGEFPVENFSYKSATLYSAVFDTSIHNIDTTLIISDGITGFSDNDSIVATKVIYGKDIAQYTPSTEIYEVDKENPYFSSYEGNLYSKDFTKLIDCTTNPFTAKLHPNTSVISEYCQIPYEENTSGKTIIVPWGITTIEFTHFTNDKPYPTVVLPDTMVDFNDTSGNFDYSYIETDEYTEGYTLIYSKYNKATADRKAYVRESDDRGNSYEFIRKKVDNVASYYGIKPNSLKTFWNGKTYYFDNNYKMAKGWKKVNGTWYYFNDYGAAVVKIWLKSGNKWYYMQEDGTMATNKWIKWYNKWYYVGKDGAMYANCKTPDGYYVNAHGVWVK